MSSAGSPRLRSVSTIRRSKRRTSSPSPRRKPLLDMLPKCSSEPLLPGTSNGGGSSYESPRSVSDGLLYRPMTCTNLFSPSSPFLSPDRLHEGYYQEDTKVVVTVTVEGSPGPVRTMAKLGSTVEETIKMVIDKYGKEGRTPKLDKNAASMYQLHISYFSLQSLDRSDTIGDIGSRNFYLRKGNDFGTLKCAAPGEGHAPQQPFPSMLFFPAHFTRMFAKAMRRLRRLWKVLCLYC